MEVKQKKHHIPSGQENYGGIYKKVTLRKCCTVIKFLKMPVSRKKARFLHKKKNNTVGTRRLVQFCLYKSILFLMRYLDN